MAEEDTVEAFLELRKRLLRENFDYMAANNFLWSSCWRRRNREIGTLYGPGAEYAKYCTIVGILSSKECQLSTVGDFDVKRSTCLSNARIRFVLVCPDDPAHLCRDFKVAYENAQELLEVVPTRRGMADRFVGTVEGQACLRFSHNIFQVKPACSLMMSFRERIEGYNVAPEFQEYLEDIQEYYTLEQLDVFKDGQAVLPEDFESTLVNHLVKVTFVLNYDVDEGINTQVSSIVVLK